MVPEIFRSLRCYRARIITFDGISAPSLTRTPHRPVPLIVEATCGSRHPARPETGIRRGGAAPASETFDPGAPTPRHDPGPQIVAIP